MTFLHLKLRQKSQSDTYFGTEGVILKPNPAQLC